MAQNVFQEDIRLLDVGRAAGDCFRRISLEIFENVAYIMAFHADPTIPKTIDEWLDQFEMFSIYQVLPEILALWGTNMLTDIESKKGLAEVSAKCPRHCSFCDA